MPTARINDVELHYELTGTGGDPLVLVHGSWSDGRGWDLVAPALAERFRVLTYDRRGHSRSERPPGQGSVHEDVADLAGLIEHLGLAPTWVAGNSFGGSVVLRLGAERPKLVRGIMAHDPPLFSLVEHDPDVAPLLEQMSQRITSVVRRIAAGDHAGAAEQFVDSVVLGPGSWAQLPPRERQPLIRNAPTFLDEAGDPDQFAIDAEKIRLVTARVLLTLGETSPPTFAPVVDRLAATLPRAARRVFAGAGHIPHVTHPEAYVASILEFTGAREAGAG